MIDTTEQIGDCQLHYIQAGEAGEAGKADLLFLHGMKFQAATWQELGTLEKMAADGYRATALDLPGFGKSPEAEVAPQQVVKDFILDRQLSKPVLVGPSMGGRVSLEFALANQDLLGGLVLVGAVGVEENKEKLAEIKLPTLIVWGSEDAISPLSNGHLLDKEIEDSRLVLVQGAPHPCYLDQPDIWHWELTNFLAEQYGK